MLFSSIAFLYVFLPLLFIVYFAVPSKFRNLVLLTFSLLFYFLGEPKYIIVLLLSCMSYYKCELLRRIFMLAEEIRKYQGFCLEFTF